MKGTLYRRLEIASTLLAQADRSKHPWDREHLRDGADVGIWPTSALRQKQSCACFNYFGYPDFRVESLTRF